MAVLKSKGIFEDEVEIHLFFSTLIFRPLSAKFKI